METIFIGGKIVIAIVFALISIQLCIKIKKTVTSLRINTKISLMCCTAICGWYALSMVLSFRGFYNGMREYSQGDVSGLLFLVMMMFIPLASFFLLYLRSEPFRKIIGDIDTNTLISIQVYRLCGVYFLLLAFSNKAPLLFALPTGIFDLMVGLFALLIPRLLMAKGQSGMGQTIAIGWNYAGLIDFALAFLIYFMYFPFRILDAPASQILIGGFFPIAFIIMFPVPLAIILHVVTLMRLKEQNRIKGDLQQTRNIIT